MTETVCSGLLTTFTFLGKSHLLVATHGSSDSTPLTILGRDKLEQKLLVTFHRCTVESALVYPGAT